LFNLFAVFDQKTAMPTCFFLNPGDAVLMLAPHQGDTHACVPSTSGTAAAVDVRLRVFWGLNLGKQVDRQDASIDMRA
jgi:hypothetical protein